MNGILNCIKSFVSAIFRRLTLTVTFKTPAIDFSLALAHFQQFPSSGTAFCFISQTSLSQFYPQFLLTPPIPAY